MISVNEVSVVTNAAELREVLAMIGGWADELHLMYAWASSNAGRSPHWTLLPLPKVRRALLGIHFAQTEPWVLRKLAEHDGRLRVVADLEGVFHPKLLLATAGDEVVAIVGSSNFTTGGFGGNTELNLLMRGDRRESPTAELLAYFDAEWASARAFEPDEEWLTRYDAAYQRRPSPPRLPAATGGAAVSVVRDASDLTVVWADYYALIAARERHTLSNGYEIHVFDHEEGSYLQEAEACRAALEHWPRFASMPESERKLVAGCGGGTTGYFGRNGGAGYFKQIVGSSPEKIGAHLDRLPLAGPIRRSLAEEVLTGLIQLHGVKLGVATRLLAVKRPDVFVTLNNANRSQVKAIFGRAPSTVRTYLDWHESIWALPWWDTPEPRRRDERRVWRARVALLDALVYELSA